MSTNHEPGAPRRDLPELAEFLVAILAEPVAADHLVEKRSSGDSSADEADTALPCVRLEIPWRGRRDAVERITSALDRLPWKAHLVATRATAADRMRCVIAVARSGRWELHRLDVGNHERDGADEGVAGDRTPGLVLAVYGVDGSGKSTLIDRLTRTLAPLFAGIERWHVLHHQYPGARSVPVTDPHGRSPRSVPISIGKAGWYLGKAWFARAPRVHLARRAGRLVILDRDLADPSLDPVRYRMKAPEAVLSLMRTVAPRPDLALVLDADAEAVRARSDELDAAMVVRLSERYLRFASDTPWALSVDARGSIDEVAFEASGPVFAILEGRIVERR